MEGGCTEERERVEKTGLKESLPPFVDALVLLFHSVADG